MDQGLLLHLRIEALEELATAFMRGVRQMDVADADARGLLHVRAARGHPVQVAEVRLAAVATVSELQRQLFVARQTPNASISGRLACA
jgi:hypothetical protein